MKGTAGITFLKVVASETLSCHLAYHEHFLLSLILKPIHVLMDSQCFIMQLYHHWSVIFPMAGNLHHFQPFSSKYASVEFSVINPWLRVCLFLCNSSREQSYCKIEQTSHRCFHLVACVFNCWKWGVEGLLHGYFSIQSLSSNHTRTTIYLRRKQLIFI